MTKLNGAIGWLDRLIDETEEKAAKLRAARDVLAEFAPGGALVAEVARAKPRLAPRGQAALPPKTFSEADRRGRIIAAAKRLPKKAAAATKLRKDGKPMPGVADWVCKACGGRGHSARSKSCPKKVAEPAPADFVERVLAAAPTSAALTPPALTAMTGQTIKGKSATQRLCRCTVLVANEFGSGGRGIVKQQPCGAPVWANDRQKHLHAEHGVIDPALDGYFEVLSDPEDESDADAA